MEKSSRWVRAAGQGGAGQGMEGADGRGCDRLRRRTLRGGRMERSSLRVGK